MPNSIKEYTVDSLQDLMELNSRLVLDVDGFNGQVPWYRGMADATWTLLPSVFRGFPRHAEAHMVTRFHLRGPGFTGVQTENLNPTDWLVLMQHHHLPTRLLDWSESLLVAAFFACGVESSKSDAVIWALLPGNLNCSHDPSLNRGKFPLFKSNSQIVTSAAARAFSADSDLLDEYLAFLPRLFDPRMVAQKSTFTIHANTVPLEQRGDAADYLTKIIIPHRKCVFVAQSLIIAGMGLSTLYPDLDGLASELRGWFRPPYVP